ncbi:MAG: ATP-dependent sacrificial sulfur transferase LarE [Deltaproteobacteria bacterium]|nr:ATP-dependent sacrificial sulfur transferase LarE [Deltaproteobacteria bacterium]
MSDKYQRLLEIIKNTGPVGVAFSGGVDSTLLLKAALAVHGADVAVFYVRSPLQKPQVEQRVLETGRRFGCLVRIVDIDPLEWSEFVENSGLRCYHCKKKIYARLTGLLPCRYKLLDGTNMDDPSEERPGYKAIKELDVRTPLLDAGLTKNEIRFICKYFRLPCWNLPSESCLATRIVTGVEITPHLLRTAESGEDFLNGQGFYGCRVRLDGQSVFISLSQGDSMRLLDPAVKREVVSFFTKLNYTKVFLELSERASILK